MRTALAIVPGSVADMAARNQGQIIPPSVCVLFDISYSMRAEDAVMADGARTSRFLAGAEQLTLLQAQYPGQIILIDFGDLAQVRPGGHPDEPNGMNTFLAPALQLAKELDTGVMRFVIISDGCPQDENPSLEVGQTFLAGIDTIAVGEANNGAVFLRKLAEATGGTYHRDTSGMRLLGATIRALLPTLTGPFA